MKPCKIVTLLISIIIIGTLSFSAIADFGNFDAYDDGGGWGDSYGSDWGSSDWGDNFDSYYYDDYEDSDSDVFFIFELVCVIIIIVIIVSLKLFSEIVTKKSSTITVNSPKVLSYPNKNDEISEAIRKNDTSFNLSNFLSFANETYVKLQNAWSERNLETVRPLLSEELYAQMLPGVEQYIRLGKVNVMERIGVQDSYLVSHSTDNEKEILTVYLYATQKDYIIDEASGEVLEGSSTDYRHSKYLITFIRAKGMQTNTAKGIESNNCPNCGAPIELSAAGKCSYCGSIISNDDHSWVVSVMKRVN